MVQKEAEAKLMVSVPVDMRRNVKVATGNKTYYASVKQITMLWGMSSSESKTSRTQLKILKNSKQNCEGLPPDKHSLSSWSVFVALAATLPPPPHTESIQNLPPLKNPESYLSIPTHVPGTVRSTHTSRENREQPIQFAGFI